MQIRAIKWALWTSGAGWHRQNNQLFRSLWLEGIEQLKSKVWQWAFGQPNSAVILSAIKKGLLYWLVTLWLGITVDRWVVRRIHHVVQTFCSFRTWSNVSKNNWFPHSNVMIFTPHETRLNSMKPGNSTTHSIEFCNRHPFNVWLTSFFWKISCGDATGQSCLNFLRADGLVVCA